MNRAFNYSQETRHQGNLHPRDNIIRTGERTSVGMHSAKIIYFPISSNDAFICADTYFEKWIDVTATYNIF